MKNPLVSVIIPVYNAQKNIVRCLESVRRQTYENLQIILINDGSKDVSLDVCQMYARVDERILLVDKANSGVSATRNLGLSLAKGEYLQFVDSDDYLAPWATALLVQKAQDFEADMVICNYYRVLPGETDAKTGQQQPDEVTPYGFLPQGLYDKRSFAENLMKEPASFYYGVMWNKLYRRDVVDRFHLQCSEELEWSEDFLFNLEYIRYTERFYSLESPLYYYVQNPASICNTKMNIRSVVSTKTALFSYYKDLYESMGLYEQNKLQIYKYLVATAES